MYVYIYIYRVIKKLYIYVRVCVCVCVYGAALSARITGKRRCENFWQKKNVICARASIRVTGKNILCMSPDQYIFFLYMRCIYREREKKKYIYVCVCVCVCVSLKLEGLEPPVFGSGIRRATNYAIASYE